MDANQPYVGILEKVTSYENNMIQMVYENLEINKKNFV